MRVEGFEGMVLKVLKVLSVFRWDLRLLRLDGVEGSGLTVLSFEGLRGQSGLRVQVLGFRVEGQLGSGFRV